MTKKFTKKERLDITRKIEKLNKSLGGIREMGGIPNLLFVIDTNLEEIAIQEAKKLGIPVVAILDSNSNPDNVSYPVPGNDDATRALKLYCRLVSEAVLSGMQESLIASGIDIGEATEISDILELSLSLEQKNAEAKAKEAKKRVVKSEKPRVHKDEKAQEEVSSEEMKQEKKATKPKTKKVKEAE